MKSSSSQETITDMKRPVTTIMLLISVAINVGLAYRLNQFKQLVAGTRIELLKPGTNVPALIVRNMNGQPRTVKYDEVSAPTVLYVLTPSCSWCARNMNNFKTLLDKEGSAYRFIGLSLSDEGLREYVTKNELTLPIYSGLSPETLKAYRLGSTPQTLVISSEGKVLQNWVGAYVGDQKTQVEAFFQVTLPGIRPGS